MCNVTEWKKAPCNYVVGVKVHNDRKAEIMGWFSRKELEDLPINDWGTGDCYHCLLTELNPMPSFIIILKQ